MYLYESHMGTLFASETALEFQELYCETCGDCDEEIGYAENALEAFEILKPHLDLFDVAICKKCPYYKTMHNCDEECDEWMKSGGYSFEYAMKFLQTAFPEESFSNVYILLKEKGRKRGSTGLYLANVDDPERPTGALCVPILTSMVDKDTYINLLLAPYTDKRRDDFILTKLIDEATNQHVLVCREKLEDK